MTMRRKGLVLLVVVVMMVTPAVAAAAGPGPGGATDGWESLGAWLAGLAGGWGEVLQLGAASETEPDGSGDLDGGTATSGTTTEEEPTSPGGELGPWKDPDGLGTGNTEGEVGS